MLDLCSSGTFISTGSGSPNGFPSFYRHSSLYPLIHGTVLSSSGEHTHSPFTPCKVELSFGRFTEKFFKMLQGHQVEVVIIKHVSNLKHHELPLKKLFNFFYVYLCACISVHHIWLYSAHGGQKRILNCQELELQMVVSHHVGAENQTQVLKMNS